MHLRVVTRDFVFLDHVPADSTTPRSVFSGTHWRFCLQHDVKNSGDSSVPDALLALSFCVFPSEHGKGIQRRQRSILCSISIAQPSQHSQDFSCLRHGDSRDVIEEGEEMESMLITSPGTDSSCPQRLLLQGWCNGKRSR